MLTPRTRGRRPSRTGCAAWRSTAPGRGLRRACAARRPRHPAARLGQPALLAAAGLARRRARAARGPGGRRGHRRQHVPLEEGLDTGPVYGLLTETIRPTDTSGDLLDRLAVAGAGLLVATLDALEDGALRPSAARGRRLLAPKLTVDDARVDWTAPALRVDRLVRACTPRRAPGRRCATSASSSARWRSTDGALPRATRRRPGRHRDARRPARRRTPRGQGRDGRRRLAARPAARARRAVRVSAAAEVAAPAARAEPQPPPSDPARLAAYDVLGGRPRRRRLRQPGAARAAARARLERPDAAFATELAYGTLRAQGHSTRCCRPCVDRPLDAGRPAGARRAAARRPPAAAHAGPRHAAVSRHRRPGPPAVTAGPASFINAVLRKVAAQDLDAWLAQLAPPTTRSARWPCEHRTPALDRLRPSATRSAATSPRRGGAGRGRRAPRGAPGRPPDRPREELVAAQGGAARPWSPSRSGSTATPAGSPGARRPRRRAGRGQPAGGARPRRRSARRTGPALGRPVRRSWGARPRCSTGSPRSEVRGSRPELQPHRAKLVAARASATSSPRTRAGRRCRRQRGPRSPRRPLLGLGALRRRPEARWRRQPSDLPGLTALQGELLDAAVALLRPGGCSPTSPARRTWPRPASRCSTCSAGTQSCAAGRATAPCRRTGPG